MPYTEEDILSLVDRIYETVEAPERWSEVVEGISSLTGTPRGLLFTPQYGPDEGGLWLGYRLGTEELEDYISYYHQKDIWTIRAYARGVPTRVPVNCDRLVSPAELDASEFYNDYLNRIDIRGALSMLFGGEQESYPRVHLSVYRPVQSDGFDLDSEQLMSIIAPHVHRALDLGFRVAGLRRRAEDELQALDHLDYAVLALNQDGSIAFRNRRAEALLAENDGLRERSHCIVADNVQDNERLWGVIRNTIGELSKGRKSAGGVLAVGRPSGRRHYTVTVAPGIGAATLAGVRGAWALLFIADPERHPELPVERIARLYGLTGSEAQLAAALTAGETLRDYAERTALSIHTVRSTLKQVFAKTGTRRQAEVVRLLLTLRGTGP